MSEERLRVAIDEAGMGTGSRSEDLELRWSRSTSLLGLVRVSQILHAMRQAAAFILQISRPSIRHSRSRATPGHSTHKNIDARYWCNALAERLGRFLYDESASVRNVGVFLTALSQRRKRAAQADRRKDIFSHARARIAQPRHHPQRRDIGLPVGPGNCGGRR